MLDVAEVLPPIRRFFNFGQDSEWVLSLPQDDEGNPDESQVQIEEGKLSLPVVLFQWDGDQLADAVEHTMQFDLTGVSRERWAAYIEGWGKAFVALSEQAGEDFRMQKALSCASVLRDAALCTSDDFARAMQDPSTFQAYCLELAPNPVPTEQEYQAYLQVARPESRAEVLQRRQDAYDRAMLRHPQVAARIAATYGFVLPKHVALTWAFFSSLSDSEWAAFAMLDLYPSRLSGVLALFKDGGLDRPLKPGFDARMDNVRREDLPELLLMIEDSQDRYSLFYDDPSHMPSGLVRSPRHGGDVFWAETCLDGLRNRITSFVSDPDDFVDEENPQEPICNSRLLLEALDDFAAHAERIRQEDRAGMQWSYEERTAMAKSACGVGIATEKGDVGEFAFAGTNPYRIELSDSDSQGPLAGWIARAQTELENGDPSYALALGRDLHFLCRSPAMTQLFWQDQTKELLVRAYRALGREALARRVEVHYASHSQYQVEAYQR